MIGRQSILGLIPARGGSQGIPRKNIRRLGDKPLIAWTIIEAQKSQYIDRLVVSTDDEEIANIAREWGADVPFLGPAALATDTARGVDVVLHALHELPIHSAVVLLQPTSPFRSASDIDGSLALWAQTGNSVVGVTEAAKSPYWMYLLDHDARLHELLPKPTPAANRQDLPAAYALNGAVYVAERLFLLEHKTFLTVDTRGYTMPVERSLDIDTETEWQYAEWVIRTKRESHPRP